MPRLPCAELAGVPLHLVQRGRGRTPCFSGAVDRRAYLDALAASAAEDGCALHAYVLMGNHVHLLLTPGRADAPARLMRTLAERYGRHLAEAYGHEGDVWDGHYDGTPVHARRYLLACMGYIELNPVRAGMVAGPGGYRWSSYRANAEGTEDALLTPHPAYVALGRSRAERCAAYRAMLPVTG